MSKKKDFIFDNGDDNGIDYSELYEGEEEIDYDEIIGRMKGTVQSGDCMYCGAKNAMKYEGDICFVCDKCGMSTHEDSYYLWLSGIDIEFDDGSDFDDYDEFYDYDD